MSATETPTRHWVKHVTITARRELERRAELEAIRRDMLSLEKEFTRKMTALTERVFKLLND